MLQSITLFACGLTAAVFYVVLWSGGDRNPAFLELTSFFWGAAWLRITLHVLNRHRLHEDAAG
ncbi:hypothetical protein ACF1B0_21800 [Streptomyces anandii]|uniref:hypothetical protein n=1 Tax=Streptomyces anandii TaxID=285454 RepID=UPI0036FE0680